MDVNNINRIQHVFIIGAKSIGQYGGYETFVDRLIGEHEDDENIKYHVACKANGEGFMDESKLSNVEVISRDKSDNVSEFTYKNAHVFKIPCPPIGPAVAIYYDTMALLYSIKYCRKHHIANPIFYVLTCRIGLFISYLEKKIRSIGGKFFLNPDGHEWKRAKWSAPVRSYWKWSEKKMVGLADLVICDSINIENYIHSEYNQNNTTYIAYGADTDCSSLDDNDPIFENWLNEYDLKIEDYYLVVGRFVPENNYETMIREFMNSKSKRSFALITNVNKKFLEELENKLHWKRDPRIKFVGTVYNRELLKKIREKAFAYLHGHEVGGTNPSLLESLGCCQLNLLLDIGFNREVGQDSALYWNKCESNLSELISQADSMSIEQRSEYGRRAKKRIESAFSWKFIGEEYKRVWEK